MSPRINRLTYDAEADAAYVSLVETSDGDMLTTAVLQGKPIHLDFNKHDELVGVEVLSASKYLPERLLNGAEKLG